MAPQMIHAVQLWAPLRQPEQPKEQRGGQRLGSLGRVAGILVQQQGDRPAGIVASNQQQEGLKVLAPLTRSRHEEVMPRLDIDRAKYDPARIAARDLYGQRLPALPSGCAQRRKEQQIRLVLKQ